MKNFCVFVFDNLIEIYFGDRLIEGSPRRRRVGSYGRQGETVDGGSKEVSFERRRSTMYIVKGKFL